MLETGVGGANEFVLLLMKLLAMILEGGGTDVQGNEYTQVLQNVFVLINSFLILSCNPFCPENSLNLLGHGLYKVLKPFHRDAGPC